MARCEQCFGWFEASASWMTLCRRCYAQNKRDEEAELRRELEYYRNLCRELTEQLAFKNRLLQECNSIPIPAEMLRRLIMLCHPDRHGNSGAATEATRWLLEQRQR